MAMLHPQQALFKVITHYYKILCVILSSKRVTKSKSIVIAPEKTKNKFV